jgi:TM2 domain-containing membrane protein YozV
MMSKEEKYCPYCGTIIPYHDDWCPSCGKHQPVMPGMTPKIVRPEKKVWIAVLASLLVTGLGQVYVGEWRKGIAFFVCTFTLGYLLSYYFDYGTIMLFGTVMAIISAYDAYLTLMKRMRHPS